MRFLPTMFVALFTPLCGMAAVVVDFRNQSGVYDSSTSVSVGLFDPDVSTAFNMTVEAIGGNLNSNVDEFGVADSFLDAGEVLTIGFDVDVRLDFIDFGGVGADVTDGVQIVTPNGTNNYFTGVSDFNGTLDLWQPSTVFNVLVGQELQLRVSDPSASVYLEQMQLSVIPEPKLTILLAIGAVGMLTRRRRWFETNE
ncbi:PEP-CTERM sorting domain-containing protein [Rubritalea marina]|uniref:PEP-CTERM sorting domain-containing protein n=1 Tax=Rubritalea marina TaxID=361055 RepID=UPI00035C691C|nr:PEP-CTERM sorting domain-containing protein [Rubritalea marina]